MSRGDNDYSNFLRKYAGWMPGVDQAADLYDAYVDKYENSHGKDRYYWGNVPFFSWAKRLEDNSKKAQDQWDNTHTDAAYADRIDNSLSSAVYSGIGLGTGIPRMASSLSTMYSPEVIENVGVTRRHRVSNM